MVIHPKSSNMTAGVTNQGIFVYGQIKTLMRRSKQNDNSSTTSKFIRKDTFLKVEVFSYSSASVKSVVLWTDLCGIHTNII